MPNMVINPFVSASAFPVKVLLEKENIIKDGGIVPLHIQLIPTNRCNNSCKFCSCSAVDRSLEMEAHEIHRLFRYFSDLGTKAVTITGGGEPLLHPYIQDIVLLARTSGIEAALVTNGIRFLEADTDWSILNRFLTWIRLSITDFDNVDRQLQIVESVRELLTNVDCGISYVIAPYSIKSNLIKACVEVVNSSHNFTHIRFVDDILDPMPSGMDQVEEICKDVNKEKVIFQRRSSFTVGRKRCLISLLKPVINPDGFIYPCCGVQYATDKIRLMPKEMRMCHWEEFHNVKPFNGSVCKKCYYEQYNDTLELLVKSVKHQKFV